MNAPGSRLTSDLVANILSRLPTKSFHRLKCASKSWLALDSDPHYRKCFPNAMARCFINPYKPPSKYLTVSLGGGAAVPDFDGCSLSFLPFPNGVVVDCCNGLLLCRDELRANVVVCNPATKKWAAIPSSPQSFNPCFMFLGFGGRLARNYYILQFTITRDNIPSHVYLFSSDTRNWKTVNLKGGFPFGHPTCAFFNGLFYILYRCADHMVVIDAEGRINPRLDLPRPRSGSSLRSCQGSEDFMHSLCVTGGNFHYVRHTLSENQIEVWIRKQYCFGDGWDLKHRVDIRRSILEKIQPCTPPSITEVLSRPWLTVSAFHPDMDAVFVTVRGAGIRSLSVVYLYHFRGEKLTEVVTVNWLLSCLPYSPLLMGDQSLLEG